MKERRWYGLCALAAWCLAAGSLFADGVTRTVEPVQDGCRVTLSWNFSGLVESDLVIEERFSAGWSAVDSTVPFGSLDASWLSGNVARFAVKPSLLSYPGSISFMVSSSNGSSAGTVGGSWKMYLSGGLCTGSVSGAGNLASIVLQSSGGAAGASESVAPVETSVTITSFMFVGSNVELSYSGVAKAGVLVVDGSKGLSSPWQELRRSAVDAGEGKVTLAPSEFGESRFFRLKLLTEEE